MTLTGCMLNNQPSVPLAAPYTHPQSCHPTHASASLPTAHRRPSLALPSQGSAHEKRPHRIVCEAVSASYSSTCPSAQIQTLSEPLSGLHHNRRLQVPKAPRKARAPTARRPPQAGQSARGRLPPRARDPRPAAAASRGTARARSRECAAPARPASCPRPPARRAGQ